LLQVDEAFGRICPCRSHVHNDATSAANRFLVLSRDACTVETMRFLAVFGLVAFVEMATFFWVESRIGLGWALALAVLTAVIGSFLVRRAGLSVLSRIQAKLGRGRLPGRELSDGAAVLVSGAFLISPGFITDVLGFLLLIPAVRDLVYRIVWKRVSARITFFDTSGEQVLGGRQDGAGSSGSQSDEVIDVEGWE
jgi:UPF0716 protein FxsA